MSVRDLGYRPYEGERLSPSNSMRVLLAYGLRRAWRSLLVKLALLFALGPVVLALLALGFVASQGGAEQIEATKWVNNLLGVQLWMFVSAATLGGGAPIIAEDLTHRAFQFYFAKPVTPVHYLAGRIGAIGVLAFVLCFVPAAILVLALTVTAAPDARIETFGLVLPALLQSVLVATVASSASVGVSATSRSRALTMSAWIVLFLVPHVIAVLVFAVGRWPWLQLASLPALLGIVGDGLFRMPAENDLRWTHAVPMLGIYVAAALGLARHRLERAEVVE